MSTVRGWCPSAHNPMMSGDGLLVRIQPRFARLSKTSLLRICDLSEQFGNGLMDLTSRGNLQLRGCQEDTHSELLRELVDLGVVSDDPASERLCTVTPFAEPGSRSHRVAAAIYDKISDLPELPAKMGIVVDAEETRGLARVSGDFRFEYGEDGLMLRADGAQAGRPIDDDQVCDALFEMAEWFRCTGGAASRRMAPHLSNAVLPQDWQRCRPAAEQDQMVPDLAGGCVGFAFGRVTSSCLREICNSTNLDDVIVTPWRVLKLQSETGDVTVPATDLSDVIHDVADPRWSTDACPGSAGCASALIDTYDIAAALAGGSKQRLHISGCAKGCARQRSAEITVVGTRNGLDLVLNGRAGDTPTVSGLNKQQLVEHVRGMS